MRRKWVEFLPSRGGYVTEHDAPPADIESRISSENGIEKIVQVRKSNGHTIQDTREFYLLIEGQPFAFGCNSTKHTFAREWTTYQNRLLHPNTGGVLPAWSHKYLLTSTRAENAKGKWFGLKFTDMGPVTGAEYAIGRQLHLAVKGGAVRGEAPTVDAA
jgi:hypothetical protein